MKSVTMSDSKQKAVEAVQRCNGPLHGQCAPAGGALPLQAPGGTHLIIHDLFQL